MTVTSTFNRGVVGSSPSLEISSSVGRAPKFPSSIVTEVFIFLCGVICNTSEFGSDVLGSSLDEEIFNLSEDNGYFV